MATDCKIKSRQSTADTNRNLICFVIIWLLVIKCRTNNMCLTTNWKKKGHILDYKT